MALFHSSTSAVFTSRWNTFEDLQSRRRVSLHCKATNRRYNKSRATLRADGNKRAVFNARRGTKQCGIIPTQGTKICAHVDVEVIPDENSPFPSDWLSEIYKSKEQLKSVMHRMDETARENGDFENPMYQELRNNLAQQIGEIDRQTTIFAQACSHLEDLRARLRDSDSNSLSEKEKESLERELNDMSGVVDEMKDSISEAVNPAIMKELESELRTIQSEADIPQLDLSQVPDSFREKAEDAFAVKKELQELFSLVTSKLDEHFRRDLTDEEEDEESGGEEMEEWGESPSLAEALALLQANEESVMSQIREREGEGEAGKRGAAESESEEEEEERRDVMVQEAALLMTLSQLNFMTNRVEKCKELMKKAMQHVDEIVLTSASLSFSFPSISPPFLLDDVCENIADMLYGMEEYEGSCLYYQRSLDVQRQIAGNSFHIAQLNTMQSFVNALSKNGRFDEAISMQKEVILRRQELFESLDREGEGEQERSNAEKERKMARVDVEKLKLKLSEIYQQAKRPTEAEETCQNVISAFESLCGVASEEYGTALCCMGIIKKGKEDLSSALDFLSRGTSVLTSCDEVYPENDTLEFARMDMAEVLQAMGRTKEAISLREQILEEKEVSLSSSLSPSLSGSSSRSGQHQHHELLPFLLQLADSCMEVEDEALSVAAEKHLRRALVLGRGVFPPGHVALIPLLERLVVCLTQRVKRMAREGEREKGGQGDLEGESLPSLGEKGMAKEGVKERAGKEDRERMMLLGEAEAYAREVVSLWESYEVHRESMMGEGRRERAGEGREMEEGDQLPTLLPSTGFSAMNMLAVLLYYQGRNEEAEIYFRRSVRWMETNIEKDVLLTSTPYADTLKSLSVVLWAQGKTKAAEKVNRQIKVLEGVGSN